MAHKNAPDHSSIHGGVHAVELLLGLIAEKRGLSGEVFSFKLAFDFGVMIYILVSHEAVVC